MSYNVVSQKCVVKQKKSHTWGNRRVSMILCPILLRLNPLDLIAPYIVINPNGVVKCFHWLRTYCITLFKNKQLKLGR